MNKIKVLDVVFWVSLIVGIIMVLWRIFGDSPTDLQVVAPFIVVGFVKMGGMNEKLIKLEMKSENGFRKIREDMGLIKERLEIW
ncbi:MAG: hypothetical protein V1889_00380 [archaeon]